jgi:Fe-S-cluster containining protein
MTSPSLAVGTEKRKKTITHQLNVNICPHLGNKNECLIYERRPLKCKAFPFDSGNFSNKCTVFSYRKVGYVYCDFAPSRSQIEASDKLNRCLGKLFQRFFVKGIKVWEYDLATKNWVFRTQHNRYPSKVL